MEIKLKKWILKLLIYGSNSLTLYIQLEKY